MEKIDYEQRVSEQFPNLQYGEFKVLNNQGERLGMDDLAYKFPLRRQTIQDLKELLVLSCSGYLEIFEAENLARSLNAKVSELLTRFNPSTSLLIFPGNGSLDVKNLLPKDILECFPSLDLRVKRVLNPNMSVNGVKVLNTKKEVCDKFPSKLEQCVLVDDVIASGSTARAIRNFVDERSKIDWYAASWMMLSPLQVRNRQDDLFQSGLFGFRRVITPLIYQGLSGIPSNTSLSSFVGSDEKSLSVMGRYREKYAEDKEAFDEAIGGLRSIIK